MLQRILRAFSRPAPQETVVMTDLSTTSDSRARQKRKLAEAARKYGRPFKCAGDDMPHEILLRGRIVQSRYPVQDDRYQR